MNIKYVVFLIFSLLATAGCSSDLPPEPEAPGLAGNYYRALGDWAVEPVTFSVVPEDRISCSGSSDIYLGWQTTDDFVYKFFYLWNENYQQWDRYEFAGEQISGSNWLRGTAEWGINGKCDDIHSLYADDANEVFAVAYSCRRDGSAWDCHGKKWQLQIAEVVPCDGVVIDGVCQMLPEDPNGPGGLQQSVFLNLNEPVTVTVDGTSYTIEVVGANSEASSGETMVLDVNGVRKTLKEGDSTTVNGLDITVSNIFVSTVPELSVSANLIISNSPGGLEQSVFLTLNNPQTVRVDNRLYEMEIVGGNVPCVNRIDESISLVVANSRFFTMGEGDNISYNGSTVWVEELFISDILNFSVAANIVINGNPYFFELNKSYSVDGLEYVISDGDVGECITYDPASARIVLDVNGVIESLEEGDITTINGLDVTVSDIFVMNVPELSVSANLIISNSPGGFYSCTDSDGGVDIFVKGTANSNAAEPYYQNSTDFCIDEWSCLKLFNSSSCVNEAVCLADGVIGMSAYECPNGCVDGACI